MRIIARKTLRQFWQRSRFADSEQPLRAWFREATRANWKSPSEVKAAYKTASVLGDSRVVFNIAGNKYRLVVKINYAYKVIYIRFIGTPDDYDKIDAGKV